MNINPALRHSAAFLVQKCRSGKIRPMASAFFVAIDMEGKYLPSYLVTARHNLEYANKNEPLYVRINKINNEFEDIQIDINEFEQHACTDVCVLPIELPVGISSGYVPYGALLRQEMVRRCPVKEGAQIYIPSLFSKFSGNKIMQSIVRTGRLALVPSEKLPAKLGPGLTNDVEGYLVESMSWGGCSGAPVFIEYFDPTATSSDPWEVGTQRLLGLISGHYEEERVIGNTDELSVSLNAGIALVIPAQGIVDLLLAEHLVQKRKNDYAEKFKQTE